MVVPWPPPGRVAALVAPVPGRVVAVSWRIGEVSQGAYCNLCRAQGHAVLQRVPDRVTGPLGHVVALCRRTRCCASYHRPPRLCRAHSQPYRGPAWPYINTHQNTSTIYHSSRVVTLLLTKTYIKIYNFNTCYTMKIPNPQSIFLLKRGLW